MNKWYFFTVFNRYSEWVKRERERERRKWNDLEKRGETKRIEQLINISKLSYLWLSYYFKFQLIINLLKINDFRGSFDFFFKLYQSYIKNCNKTVHKLYWNCIKIALNWIKTESRLNQDCLKKILLNTALKKLRSCQIDRNQSKRNALELIAFKNCCKISYRQF